MTLYNPLILRSSNTKPKANSAFRPFPFVRGSGFSSSTKNQFKDTVSGAEGLDYNSPSPWLRISVANSTNVLTVLWQTQLEVAAWAFHVHTIALCDDNWIYLGCDAMRCLQLQTTTAHVPSLAYHTPRHHDRTSEVFNPLQVLPCVNKQISVWSYHSISPSSPDFIFARQGTGLEPEPPVFP